MREEHAGRRVSGRALVGAALVALAALPAHAREVTDATGARVKLAEHPARVVTLAPSLGELAADLSGTDLSRIVGVSEYTDYPPALAKAASIGQYARFNLEKVVSLKPDLVLATLDGNPKDQVLHLRELGVPIVVVATANLSDVGSSMRLVGQALGVPEDGERMATKFDGGLKRLRAGVPAMHPTVLLQLGGEPLVVAGKGSFLDDALAALGARNVYGDSDAHYPKPSMEDVVHRDPARIIVLALGHDLAPFEAMAKSWSRFPSLHAVKEGRVKVLQGDAVLRPTMRLLEGLATLRRTIYGDR